MCSLTSNPKAHPPPPPPPPARALTLTHAHAHAHPHMRTQGHMHVLTFGETQCVPLVPARHDHPDNSDSVATYRNYGYSCA